MHMHAKVHKYKQFYIYIPKKCSNVCSTVTDTLERPVVGFLKLANPIKDTCTLSSFFLKDLPCCDTHLRLQIQFHSTLHKTWRAYYQECMKLYGSLDLGCGPKSKPIITIYMCVLLSIPIWLTSTEGVSPETQHLHRPNDLPQEITQFNQIMKPNCWTPCFLCCANQSAFNGQHPVS